MSFAQKVKGFSSTLGDKLKGFVSTLGDKAYGAFKKGLDVADAVVSSPAFDTVSSMLPPPARATALGMKTAVKGSKLVADEGERIYKEYKKSKGGGLERSS